MLQVLDDLFGRGVKHRGHRVMLKVAPDDSAIKVKLRPRGPEATNHDPCRDGMRPAQSSCDQRQARPTNPEVQTHAPKVGGSNPPSATQNAVHRWSVNELAAAPGLWAVVWVPGFGVSRSG
jgi:hypothetical protein